MGLVDFRLQKIPGTQMVAPAVFIGILALFWKIFPDQKIEPQTGNFRLPSSKNNHSSVS